MYYKNPMVESPEYFRMLTKDDSDLLLTNEDVFHLVWNMLKRYRIKNISQVKALGYDGTMPDKLEEIIKYQKNIPAIILKQTPWSKILMKRCYKKITQGLYK